jgi:microcystin degradation protein MlrC
MEKILVNTHQYDGKYVALKSAKDNTVVGVGKTPEKALNNAKEKGIQSPFIIYIPDREVVHIYCAR